MHSAAENLAFFDQLRRDYWQGKLTYDEAKAKAEPRILEINRKATEVARKHGRSRPSKLNFAALMR